MKLRMRSVSIFLKVIHSSIFFTICNTHSISRVFSILLFLFKEVMMQAKRCSSIETATKIHQLVLNDPNSDVLLGGPTPQNEYYMGY